ncbi:hypothetical protein BsWGS_14669 [Bradybaena similaris]
MASSNVQYYEKQRRLQHTITDCQQQRMDLERQLQMALKADQVSSKMKASRLHTYWRQICDNERQAKQRNEMIIRDFERIDSHMSKLNARTQSLALMKKQYEDYISRTYPKWNDFMNSSPQHAEAATDHHHHDASSALSLNPQSAPETGRVSSRSYSSASVDVKYKTGGRSETVESATCHQPEKDQHKQQQQQQQHQWENQQSIYSKEPVSHTHQADNTQKVDTNFGVYANLPSNRADNQTPRKSEASDEVNVKHHKASTMFVQNKDLQSHIAEKPAQPRSGMHAGGGESGEDEDISDFGSDSELPMAQSLGNTKIPQNSPPDPRPVKSSSQTNGASNPELSVDGLVNLLQLVETEMVEAFSCEDYYRSSVLPHVAEKNDIIRKANSDGDLSKVDTSMITMVILEQITHIVQTLTEKCLLSEELLRDASNMSAAMLRQQLSPEAQIIWDALYAHFMKLVQCDVLKPQEVASIFTPCLVFHGETLDKGHKFIVRILERSSNSTHKHSPIHNNKETTSPGQTMESSESLMEDGRVPPLKFGSLLDKHLSEDESSYVTSSLPQDPVPLNETAAYRSMVSGSGSRQPPRQMSGQDDTDDDVEKQIASALVRNPVMHKTPQKPNVADEPSETSSQTLQTSPHVYVPTAMESRQAVNLSKTAPSKFQGVKISSDLDTDTEVDAGIFGSSRRPEDNSDFDFYD